MIRLLAMVLNVGLLLLVGWLVLSSDRVNAEAVWYSVFFANVATFNLLALAKVEGSKNWLLLYWRRRALEEEQRIQTLGR